VRAHDGGHAAVEMPAQRDLLACGLGVEVDEHVVRATLELAEGGVDLRERRPSGAQEDVAAEVDDAEPDALAVHDTGAVSRLVSQVVVGAQDLDVVVEIAVDLLAVIGVVAERNDVDAGGEELVGDLRRDPQPPGCVLAVDDDERRLVAFAQPGQQPEQRALAKRSDDVADEENARGLFRHGPVL